MNGGPAIALDRPRAPDSRPVRYYDSEQLADLLRPW